MSVVIYDKGCKIRSRGFVFTALFTPIPLWEKVESNNLTQRENL